MPSKIETPQRKNNENISPPIRVVSDRPHFSVIFERSLERIFFRDLSVSFFRDTLFMIFRAYALPNSI